MISACKRWAEIIRESPSFWCFVTTSPYPAPSLNIVLPRSRSYPLAVSGYSLGDPKDDEALFEQMDRWKDVAIRLPRTDGWDGFRFQHQLWNRPAPLLETFAVFHEGISNRMPYSNLFGGMAPNIRSLRMTAFWIKLKSPIFTQLHQLELVNHQIAGHSAASFSVFLGQCQLLTSLRMAGIGLDRTAGPSNPEQQEPVNLPNLKTLILERLTQNNTLTLLAKLYIPQCTELLKIWYGCWETDEEEEETNGDQDEIPGNARTPTTVVTIKNIFAFADRILLKLSRYYDDQEVAVSAFRRGRSTFELSLDETRRSMDKLCLLAEEWGLAAVKVPITLVLDFIWLRPGGVTILDTLPLLRLLPSTTKIVLSQSDPPIPSLIIPDLTDPFVSDDQIHWVCPNLEHLIVGGNDGMLPGKIVKMLESRSGEGYKLRDNVLSSVKTETGLRLPKPLRQLVLEGFEHDVAMSERTSRLMAPGCELAWNLEPGFSIHNIHLRDEDNGSFPKLSLYQGPNAFEEIREPAASDESDSEDDLEGMEDTDETEDTEDGIDDATT